MRAVWIALQAVVIAVILASAAAARPHEQAGRYGGLGATVAAFYAQNTHGAGQPLVGIAYYHVDRMRRGRVIAFDVVTNFQPPPSANERLALLLGIDLPADITGTSLNSTYCVVVRSRTLGKLIGMPYAVATTDPYSDSASMRAEAKPHC